MSAVHGTVQYLYRYPVKGLSPEALDAVTLSPGLGLPLDRHFAIARPDTRFDPAAPEWLSKRAYFMLMIDGRLAALDTRYDDATGTLVLLKEGREVAKGDLRTAQGRAAIEDFVGDYLGEKDGRPRLVESPARFMFSDYKANVISIISLTSLRALEAATGRKIDPLRFRANFYVEGLEPWAEFDWIGRTVGLGAARLEVISRIVRCAATNVEPGTGKRDMNIPKALHDAFDHADLGIYLTVKDGGRVERGDRLVA
jgi:uncharacterized protein YcbX